MLDGEAILRGRLEDLRRKREKRADQAGYAENVKDIDAQIAEIEAALGEGENG
jgi:hypothetical protein